MRRLKIILAYLLFFTAACIVFLYVLFPGDLAKDYIQFRARQTLPNLTVRIGSLALYFPCRAGLKGTEIFYPNTSFFFDTLTIRPAIPPLFRGRWDIRIRGAAYQGTLESRARQGANPEHWSFNTDLRRIRLEQIPLIKAATNLKMTGFLDGTVTSIIEKKQDLKTDAQLVISDSSLNATLPVLDKIDFKFDRIEMDFVFHGDTLQLTRAEAAGPQIRALAAGTIELKQPLEESVLNLDVTIQPQAGAFHQVNDAMTKELLNLIKSNFSIKVFGTLQAPDYYLNSEILLN